MAKYSYELKKKIVDEYFEGKGGCEFLAKKYNISTKSVVRRWINAYKASGDDGLKRSRQNKNYTLKEKLNIVELYLSNEISYQELANEYHINNPSLITRWVNDYRIAGIDALEPKKKGRKSKMKKDKVIPIESSLNTSDTTSKLKELEEELKEAKNENLKLKIENAYLKELRRLRLEEEKKRKKHE